MAKPSVSIAIAGYGGTGVITTGQLLLQAASKAGYFGLAQRSFGPQIRGGESLSLLRLARQQVLSPGDVLDILVLLDTQHVNRFSAEVPLSKASLVIIAQSKPEVPDFVMESCAQVIHLPLQELAAETPAGGENIITAGLLANYLGLDKPLLQSVVQQHFINKTEVRDLAQQWCQAGWQLALEHPCNIDITLDSPGKEQPDWLVNGSDLIGLGALKAGIRFVAAYPITPASGVLEWLAPNLEQVDGNLLQAEDELASINMIIGSSFGGVPSLTATSGPGLALMAESIGLAVASEIPLVVVNVMRGGPSTGIPTKSEQSDLNIALHGLHGDAPHVVTGALSIADGVFTTGWSVWLAEHLQVPVISLSDQSMAQSDASIIEPPQWPLQAQRLTAAHSDTPYHRYALTEDGISPMSLPGEADMMYTADGLEHNPAGTPSAAALDHRQQLSKRAHKLADFDYAEHWADITGHGSTVIVCWGSVSSVAKEAARRLIDTDQPCKVIALRLLAPLQSKALLEALQGADKVLVVEQSYSAQFYGWLRSHLDFPCAHHSLAIPGPLSIRPIHIIDAIENWSQLIQEQEHAANC